MSNYIRLKTSTNEKHIENRLQYKPEIIELYLTQQDLENEDHLLSMVRKMKRAGVKVYLHHPDRFQGEHLDILSNDPEMIRYYRQSSVQLAEICEEEQIKCVIHAHYAGTESSLHYSKEKTREMKDKISEIEAFAKGCFLWEDTIEGLFSYANPYLIDEIIIPLRLPLNVDLSHTFIAFKGNQTKLEETLIRTKDYARYYHVVDSKGLEHDSLPLGNGSIHWKNIKPLIEKSDFIFEIGLKDNSRCDEMIHSVEFFKQI